jgi:L-alanine-DL-glutamate epimerase-like enolase superfamily enzyme
VAGTHLCQSLPNAMIQEGVRAFYGGWYADVVTELPDVVNGFVSAPVGAGLGTRLRPDFLLRPDLVTRTTQSTTAAAGRR